MMNNQKISVVTVCFNAAATLEETMLSVINQTYDNIEYIIIDGGSTDGSVDIIRKYEDKVAYWVSEPDKGIYDAMNKGIKVATGDYINFMNAGDTFYTTDTVSLVANQISLSGPKTIYYGDTIYKYTYGKVLIPGLDFTAISKRLPFCHQSVFVLRDVHQLRPFNTKYKYCADYDFVYEISKDCSFSAVHLDLVVSVYEAEEGLSSKQFKNTFREMCSVRGEEGNIAFIRNELSLRWAVLKSFVRRHLPSTLALVIQKKLN